jgi:2-succinyl-5-enolpyruvyl-6-hydroxy-3-cyclohexene-1-carboxylate synthase
MRVHVRLDERSAGFFALGLALATRRPTVICTTSGTAAAELHPSVLEAHHAGVPLLVCTADRPPELQDVGAPQTVDQVHLFGRAVRWFVAPEPGRAEAAPTWRPMAARAYAEAAGGPAGPGPVHLNLAFREPLVEAPGPLPARVGRGVPVGRGGGAGPATGTGPATGPQLGSAEWPTRRGVLVVGEGGGPPASVLGLARVLGWPVLADPRSGCRVADPSVVAGADLFLRDPTIRRALLPEMVVSLGSAWASKSVGAWLGEASAHGAAVVAVDPWWRWRDPDAVVTTVVRSDPGRWLHDVREEVAAGAGGGGGSGWLRTWSGVEAASQAAVDGALGHDAGQVTEPALARSLLPLLPPGCQVLLSSSMPIRDFESFTPALDDPPVVHANRGVNGIDGVSSTALGLAAGGTGPVVAVLGDLAFLHDVSALVRGAGSRPGSSCTLVVVDNGGGGIFSFLPQARELDGDVFEELFGTPQVPDALDVARGFGIPAASAGSLVELAAVLERYVAHEPLAVVRVAVPDRTVNLAHHERLFSAVAAAARPVVG